MVRLDLVRREHLQRLPALVGRERDGIAERPRGAHRLTACSLKFQRKCWAGRSIAARKGVLHRAGAIGGDVAAESYGDGARAVWASIVGLEEDLGDAHLLLRNARGVGRHSA